MDFQTIKKVFAKIDAQKKDVVNLGKQKEQEKRKKFFESTIYEKIATLL